MLKKASFVVAAALVMAPGARPARATARLAAQPPAYLYFVTSAAFSYLGPSFAVLLFARVQVLGVVWLRIVSAAVIFAAWRRPWRMVPALDRRGRELLLGWGAVLAAMNTCFYLAISRLPLGTVAAIEFLPVIALAALGARSARNALALALAVTGVYLLTDIRLAGALVGLAFAFANAALFWLYIVLADKVAKRPQLNGVDGRRSRPRDADRSRGRHPDRRMASRARVHRPDRAARRRRRRPLLLGDPLRPRPVRPDPPAARHLRRHGRPPASLRDDHRHHRPQPDPQRDRDRRHHPRHRRRRPASPSQPSKPQHAGQRQRLPIAHPRKNTSERSRPSMSHT